MEIYYIYSSKTLEFYKISLFKITQLNGNDATTFSIMTLSTKGLFVTLSITVSSVIMLSVAFFIDVLSVVLLNVVMLSVVAPMSTTSSKYF